MKYLTLIRHAKSTWDMDQLSDFERPLNKRGKKDAPRMGQSLEREIFKRGRFPRPDRLVSSSACRALSTAKIIAWEIGYPCDGIVAEPRIYEASPVALLCLVREFETSLGHVMVFGHNPGIESLAQSLDPSFQGDGEKFPTCGVAILELKAGTWSEVAEGGAVHSTFLCPRMLPS